MTTHILSTVQKQVYDEVHRLTEGGRVEWVGTLKVGHLGRSTINTAVAALEGLEIISAPGGEARYKKRFTLLVAKDEVRAGTPSEVMMARDRHWHTFVDRPVKLDDGRFMARLAEIRQH